MAYFKNNPSNWYTSMKSGTGNLRVTFWEKGVGHPKIQHGGHFFKMATISVKCSLCQLFKQWCRHNIFCFQCFFGKQCLSLKNSRWQPFFKMAAISLESLHQFFKWWCYHQIWYKYSSRDILMEKGVCHSKIQDGDHFQDGHHQFNVSREVLTEWTSLHNKGTLVTSLLWNSSMGFSVSWSSFTYTEVLD